MRKCIHFRYAANYSNELFETIYCCISIWNHFVGRYTVIKSGEVVTSSLIEVFAYDYTPGALQTCVIYNKICEH